MDVLILLTLLVALVYAVRILEFRSAWNRMKAFDGEPTGKTFVSVLIPVRNEEQSLPQLLECLGRQDYPSDRFEILVIDDHSTDNTAEAALRSGMGNVHAIRLHSGEGKKAAISYGVEQSRGELILTLDADVRISPQWLPCMAAFYEQNSPVLIAGPVLAESSTGLAGRFQSAELLALTAGAGASMERGAPLLCSGANLGFTRSAFREAEARRSDKDLPSGDDMFLMMELDRLYPGRVVYLKSKEAAAHTSAENGVTAWSQRQRWASKTFRFGWHRITAFALLVFGLNFLLVLCGILSAINVKFAYALMTSLSVKWLADFSFLRSASSFFKQKINPVLFFIFSWAYPVYITITGLTAPFRSYTWKGRRS